MKEASDEVHFLHADKHERLIQIDTMILVEMAKHSQSSQNSKFVMSLQCRKKEVRDQVDLLQVDKHQRFLQIDFNNLGIKVSYKVMLSLVIKHSQITQSNKSLQYLYNISKEKVRTGLHFLHADKHPSFYILALSFLMEVTSYVRGTQNKKF